MGSSSARASPRRGPCVPRSMCCPPIRPADRALLEGLADWCSRYTPLVALDGDSGLLSRHHRLRPSSRRREIAARRPARSPLSSRRRGPGGDLVFGRALLGGGALRLAKRDRFREEAVRVLAPLADGCPAGCRSRHDRNARPGRAQAGRRHHRGAARTACPPLRHPFCFCASIRRIGLEDEPLSPRLPVASPLGRAAAFRAGPG